MHPGWRELALVKLRRRRWNIALDLLSIAIILWVAHYFLFRSLGLYEDDYAFISQPFGWSLSDLLGYLKVVATLPQGRPLGFFLPHALAFVAGKLGGLSVVYIVAYAIQTTNAFLFYFLLRRIGLRATAAIGALAFGLFPADTTHILLVHTLGLHSSLTFLLLASHFYVSGNRTLAHLFSLMSLITYESRLHGFLGNSASSPDVGQEAAQTDGASCRNLVRDPYCRRSRSLDDWRRPNREPWIQSWDRCHSTWTELGRRWRWVPP